VLLAHLAGCPVDRASLSPSRSTPAARCYRPPSPADGLAAIELLMDSHGRAVPRGGEVRRPLRYPVSSWSFASRVAPRRPGVPALGVQVAACVSRPPPPPPPPPCPPTPPQSPPPPPPPPPVPIAAPPAPALIGKFAQNPWGNRQEGEKVRIEGMDYDPPPAPDTLPVDGVQDIQAGRGHSRQAVPSRLVVCGLTWSFWTPLATHLPGRHRGG